MRKVLKGKGVSNGIGFGKVVLLKPEDLKVEKSKIEQDADGNTLLNFL